MNWPSGEPSGAPAAARRSRYWPRGLLACLALGCVPVAHANGDDVSACLNAKEAPAQTIAHCTAAIDAQDLADARRASLYTQRGLARMATRDLERAREDFDAALHLDGNAAWAYNARAVYWMQKGETGRAIGDYERAVQIKPDYAFSWANLGNARLIHGDIDRALADLDEAIRRTPERGEIALTTRGRAHLAKGDYAHALEDFAAALAVNPRHANAVSGLGYVRFCQGDFDAAAVEFGKERKLRHDAESAVDLLLAVRRGGHDGKATLADLIGHDYPSEQGLPPALALFSGAITPDQALQSAEDRDPGAQRQRLCAAAFEVAEWYLLGSDSAAARRYFSTARESCNPSQGEFAAAGAELSRLP